MLAHVCIIQTMNLGKLHNKKNLTLIYCLSVKVVLNSIILCKVRFNDDGIVKSSKYNDQSTGTDPNAAIMVATIDTFFGPPTFSLSQLLSQHTFYSLTGNL